MYLGHTVTDTYSPLKETVQQTSDGLGREQSKQTKKTFLLDCVNYGTKLKLEQLYLYNVLLIDTQKEGALFFFKTLQFLRKALCNTR